MEAMMDSNRNKLDNIIKAAGYDFKWITGDDVVVSQWVRMKCMFGCDGYGSKATCPPNTPAIDACRELFSEYTKAALIHIPKVIDEPEARHKWTQEINDALVKLETDVFIAGYYRAFMLTMGSCYLCAECARMRVDCIHKEASRPTPESFCVDVFATARNCGYPIEVLKDYGLNQDRYALLLVE